MNFIQTVLFRHSRFKKEQLRKCAILLSALTCFIWANAQTNQWTWITGDNIINQRGVHGANGIADAANTPGSRYLNSGWKDAAGNFWIFGGNGRNVSGSSGYLNDLWKFDLSTGQWTWFKGGDVVYQPGVYGAQGTADPSNIPGGRKQQSSWMDASGNCWVFGGTGIDASNTSGYLNDLWKYDTTTGQWTWISGDNTCNQAGVYGVKGTAGPANKPGARVEQAAWTDANGNFWLFGGYGYYAAGLQGYLNDLWKYNPSTGEWTWVSGPDTYNERGVYGTQGIADVANYPGSRTGQASWVDGSGNFWLFGGFGYAEISGGYLNDLWKYNPSTGQWTWISGDKSPGNLGVYGAQGIATAANKPGGRTYMAGSVDGNGDCWIFGGTDYDEATASSNRLNDLWKYNLSTGQWTWISGDKTNNQLSVYGTKGTAATTNKPGGRFGQVSWIDASGNGWIFGGYGYDATTSFGFLNDLWKISSLVTLPIHQITWQGITRNGENILNWQTTGEENTARFQIERSTNGTDYSVIGTVPAVGFGNNRYSFTDNNLTGTSLYYRLKSEDINGSFGYSKILVMSGIQSSTISVYPNPASTHVTIQMGDNSLLNTHVKVYDAGGRLVDEIRISSLQQIIDLRHMPRGTLMLQLSNGSVFKILKE